MADTISLFDTSVCTDNLGDEIIMASVQDVLYSLFSDAFFVTMPTHDRIWKNSYRFIKRSSHVFVGGSNLLSSNMNVYNQWKINLFDSVFLQDAILMGVGWWQYQDEPNMYTRCLLKRVLSDNYIHSVRDSYTERQLKGIGIPNVVNTSCPTMWGLTPEHCASIPTEKSNAALLTYTSYNQVPKQDAAVYDVLDNNYEEIYFWPQSLKDYEYIGQFATDKCTILQPNLRSLDQTLADGNVDYVGTRLHAGIRALQYRRRTLVLEIDNRTTEIAKDTNLPSLPRSERDRLTEWINSVWYTSIKLPQDAITRWMCQFETT